VLIIFFISFSNNSLYAQNIGINSDGSTPDANAMLDIKASNKGLLIPRTSTTSRIAIPNTKGLLVYDTTLNSFWYNDGANWQQISNGSSSLNGTTNYIAKFTGASTAGNSQIFDNGQYVGIGTTTPSARLHVIDSSVLFSAAGDVPATPHNTPISLGGRRLMWYADKAAFRVGYAVNNEWDSVNIGKYSVGMGYGNMATGLYSVSIGNGSSASGISSIATGDLTNATGDYTFTTGQYTLAKGPYSFAAGYYSAANGFGSIALGYRSNANGQYAVAIGNNTYAAGNYSTAFGYSTQPGGNYSFAAGNASFANGNSAAAVGTSTVAQGDYSFATGYKSEAEGNSSLATGYQTLARGDFSTATGIETVAGGNSGFAAGFKSYANGITSVAMGYTAGASGDYSFAEGLNVTANGQSSVALGTSVTAGGANSFVWGNNSNTTGRNSIVLGVNLFDGGHKGNAMLGDTDPWNAGSVGSATDDQMICRFNNGYYFITGGNTNRTGILANHGDNSWSQISDSTKKEKMIPVNGEDLLHKIATFKLTTWNYKGQDSKTFRHYGPMAQDFHNAFGHDALGTIGNDTLINQADFLGVSFTAIQALEKRTERIEQQQKQIAELQNQNQTLVANNEKLQKQLTLLLSTVSALDKKVETLAAVQNNSNAVVKK